MTTQHSEFADGKILLDVTGSVARLTFNKPQRMNAMSLDMWQGLSDALAVVATDDTVRVVIIGGAGDRAFVSGADISEFEKVRSSPDDVAHYNAVCDGADQALYHFPKPTIAELKGFCVGGGMGLAVACDFRIAADDTRMGITAAKLGLGYGYDGIAKLVALAGPAVAAKVLYTGQLFDAEEAMRMGLVTQVVPRAQLSNEIDALADLLCSRAPKTQAASKAAIRALTAPDGGIGRAGVEALVRACFDSEDYREGRTAFAEKRSPVFRNR